MTSARTPSLTFKGEPHALVASAGFLVPRGVAGVPEIELDGLRHRLHFEPDESSGRTTLRLALAAQTPPGKLRGTVHIGGRRHAASVQVEPSTRLRIDPPRLSLSGHSGTAPPLELRIENQGNAPVELAPGTHVVLRRADAFRRCVREAFAGGQGDVVDRVVKLGAALGEEPALRAEVRVEADFQALPAGGTGRVRLALELPAGLDRSASWSGTFVLLGRSVPVTLEAEPGAPRRDAA